MLRDLFYLRYKIKSIYLQLDPSVTAANANEKSQQFLVLSGNPVKTKSPSHTYSTQGILML